MATNNKLFGFKLPKVEREDKSKSVVSPIPSNEEDKSDFYISSGFYGQYVDIVKCAYTQSVIVQLKML